MDKEEQQRMEEQLQRIINYEIPIEDKLSMILSRNCDYGSENGAMLSVNAMPKAIDEIILLFSKQSQKEKIVEIIQGDEELGLYEESLSLIEAAKLYGQILKCKWLDHNGDDWFDKEIKVDYNFLRQMEQGSIKDVYVIKPKEL